MADEVARPKIVLEVDHRKAIANFIETGEATKDLGRAVEALGKQFESGAERSKKSESSIKRLMDTVGGGGATSKFNDLAEAVNRLGGVEKLTSTQTEQLVKQMDRLKAAGGAVPDSLKGIGGGLDILSKSMTTISVDMDAWSKKLGALGAINVGPAIAAGIGAAATAVAGGLAAAGIAMVKYSSDVINVHERTGLATDTIQKLMFVAGQADVPFEKLSAGAVKLQKGLGEGGDKARAAIQALGLSFDELRNKSPDAALSTVLEKVSQVENVNQRAAIGTALLGKSFQDLLPVGAQMGELSDQAERLGLVMSESDLAAAEALGDEFTALSDTLMGVVRNVGSVITSNESLHVLITGVTDIIGKMSLALGENKDAMGSLVSTGVSAVAQGLVLLVDGVSIAVDVWDSLRLTWKSAAELALTLAIAQNELATAVAIAGGATEAELAVYDEEYKTLVKLREETRTSADQIVNSNIEKQNAIEMVKSETLKLAKAVEEAAGKEREIAKETQKTIKPFDDQAEASKKSAAEIKKSTKDAAEAAKKAAADMDEYNKKIWGTAMGPFPEDVGPAEKLTVNRLGGSAVLSGLTSFDPTRAKVITDIQKSAADMAKTATAELSKTETATKGVVSETKTWSQTLADVANAAQFISPAFGDIAGQIAAGSAALETLKTNAAAPGGLFGKANIGKTLTGGIQLLGAGKDIFDKGNPFGGALAGAGMGAQFGPYGAAIGAGLGAALGIAGKLVQSESEKVAKDVARDFGVNISEELAKAIEEEGRGRLDGALLHLSEMIGEAGGLEKFGAGRATGAMRDLFSAVDRGTITLQEAGAVFDETFGDVAASQVSKTTGIASAQLRELILLAKDFGLESEALREFMKGQATSAAGGIAGGLGSLKSAREAAEKRGESGAGIGLAGQGAASGLSNAIVGDFGAMTAAGMSTAEALAAIAPAVAAMREELTVAGLEGGAAFAALEERIRITTDAVTGPLVTGVGSFATSLVNLHNMNLLTAEDFAGITAQIGGTILALEEQGVVGPAAAQALAPDLQKIWELQQQTGFAVDETTQNLINQAVEAGMVGEAHKSAADKMADASERTASAVEFLAARFGYLADAMDKVPSEKHIVVSTEYTTSGDGGPPPSGGYAGGKEPLPFAGGSDGFRNFGSETPAYLHGMEAVITPSDFRSIASTSMSAGAELMARGAMRPDSMASVSSSMAGIYAPGGGPSGIVGGTSTAGGAVTININGANKDPKQIADEVAYVLTRGHSPALLDEIRKRART